MNLNIEKHILNLFNSVDNTALGFFTKIGPYITAAIPALLAGYGLFKQFSGPDTDDWFGVLIGIAVGVGFEAAGIKIIHTAIEYSDKKKNAADIRFILLVTASLIFVALVSFTIFTADKAYPWIVRVVGGISPILAALAYFAIGIEKSLTRETQMDDAKKALDMTLYEETERQKRTLELEREKLAFEEEKARKKAELEAYRESLKLKAEDEHAERQHQLQMERLKTEQKHEKALTKMEKAASTSSTKTRGKPFRRYDEFEAALAKTENLEEVSRQMSLSIKTIRSYKRKFDDFQAELTASTASTSNDQNLLEVEQPNLNGHL